MCMHAYIYTVFKLVYAYVCFSFDLDKYVLACFDLIHVVYVNVYVYVCVGYSPVTPATVSPVRTVPYLTGKDLPQTYPKNGPVREMAAPSANTTGGGGVAFLKPPLRGCV